MLCRSFAAALLLCCLSLPLHAQTSDEQNLIDRADVTVRALTGNKDYTEFGDLLSKAKAVLIVPQLLKAAFFFGGEGGNGVMLARLPGGGWSAPSFEVIGSASFGIQFGAKSSEIVFLIMTDRGLDTILKSNVKLGADVSVALITIGKGLGASTALNRDADIYAVAKTDGLFGGAAFDGSIITSLDEWNEGYYGHAVEPRPILNGQVPVPQGAGALIADLH